MHRLDSAGPMQVTVYTLGLMPARPARSVRGAGWLYAGLAVVTIYAVWLIASVVGVLIS